MPCGAPVTPCGSQKNSKKNLKIFFGAYRPWKAPVTPHGSQKNPKKFFEIFFKILEVPTCPG